MKLINSITIGKFKANQYENKLGYSYKIFNKEISGNNQPIARSYVFFNDKNQCYERIVDDLNASMGISQMLF